jgi:hypothetical protein
MWLLIHYSNTYDEENGWSEGVSLTSDVPLLMASTSSQYSGSSLMGVGSSAQAQPGMMPL